MHAPGSALPPVAALMAHKRRLIALRAARVARASPQLLIHPAVH
jgi:hypothetical protein